MNAAASTSPTAIAAGMSRPDDGVGAALLGRDARRRAATTATGRRRWTTGHARRVGADRDAARLGRATDIG